MCISAWLDNNKIFINERLTKDRRSLFGKARTYGKENNFNSYGCTTVTYS